MKVDLLDLIQVEHLVVYLGCVLVVLMVEMSDVMMGSYLVDCLAEWKVVLMVAW